RGSSERCPECGRLIANSGTNGYGVETSCSSIPRRILVDRVLIVATALAGIGVVRSCLSNWRQTIFQEQQAATRLERHVHDLEFAGTPLDQAIDALVRQTGVRIVKSQVVAGRTERGFHSMLHGGANWKSPVWAHLHDVSLADALRIITRQGQFVLPISFEPREDGTIFIGAEDELSQFVRVYDTEPLYDLLDASARRHGDVSPDLDLNSGPANREISVAVADPLNGHFGDFGGHPFPWVICFGGKTFVACPRRCHGLVERRLAALLTIRAPWPANTGGELHDGVDMNQWTYDR